jgi:hypothetical protein
MNGNTRLVEKSWKDAKQLCLNCVMTIFYIMSHWFSSTNMGFKTCWKVIKKIGLLSNLS